MSASCLAKADQTGQWVSWRDDYSVLRSHRISGTQRFHSRAFRHAHLWLAAAPLLELVPKESRGANSTGRGLEESAN